MEEKVRKTKNRIESFRLRCLCWRGRVKYYKVGGKRLEVRDTKVENDNFYLLTLAAVAKELNRRGMRNADTLLSVGLPLTRFGAEKQDFIDYLSKKKELVRRQEGEFIIRIEPGGEGADAEEEPV